jgi:hypothetical protein
MRYDSLCERSDSSWYDDQVSGFLPELHIDLPKTSRVPINDPLFMATSGTIM